MFCKKIKIQEKNQTEKEKNSYAIHLPKKKKEIHETKCDIPLKFINNGPSKTMSMQPKNITYQQQQQFYIGNKIEIKKCPCTTKPIMVAPKWS